MSTATLTSKGQLTLPREVREALRVGPGDRLEFVLREDGTYAVLPATRSVQRLRGMIGKPADPVSLRDMDDAVAGGSAS